MPIGNDDDVEDEDELAGDVDDMDEMAEDAAGIDLFDDNFERDYETLAAFKEFREEAERKSFRYFLEVFDPNVDPGISAEKVDGFINDHEAGEDSEYRRQ